MSCIDKHAAITIASGSMPSAAPKATSLPRARSPGKLDKIFPKGVTSEISLLPSNAPRAASFSRALSTFVESGGWIERPRIAFAELTVTVSSSFGYRWRRSTTVLSASLGLTPSAIN